MSMKSGWCMDEVQYRNLGNEDYAYRLHKQCRSPQTCPCENHEVTDAD